MSGNYLFANEEQLIHYLYTQTKLPYYVAYIIATRAWALRIKEGELRYLVELTQAVQLYLNHQNDTRYFYAIERMILLMHYIKSFGYEVNPDGICEGFRVVSMMYMDTFPSFNFMIDTLFTYSPTDLVEKIKAVRNKWKDITKAYPGLAQSELEKYLSQEEYALLYMEHFLQSFSIAQTIHLDTPIHNREETITCLQGEKYVMDLLTPVHIKQLGGFCDVYTCTGVYSAADIKIILNAIVLEIHRLGITQKVHLQLVDGRHTLGISYFPNEKQFVVAYGMYTYCFPTASIELVSDSIKKEFTPGEPHIYAWKLFMSGQTEKNAALSNALAMNPNLQLIQAITPAKATFVNQYNTTWLTQTTKYMPTALEFISDLIKAGANPMHDIHYDGPVTYALHHRDMALFKYYTDKQAFENILPICNANNFYMSVFDNNVFLKWFLSVSEDMSHPDNLQKKDHPRLLWQAVDYQNVNAVSLLLEYGADPCPLPSDPLDKSPMVLAISHNNVAIMALLFTYGASFEEKHGDKKLSLLQVAASFGSSDALAFLIQLHCERGIAFVAGEIDAAIVFAVKDNHLACLKHLLALQYSPYVDSLGYSPLHLAAELGRHDLISLLLLHYDANALDHDRQTPAMLAVKAGHLKSAALLITRGNVNHPVNGEYLLQVAIERQDFAMVQLLFSQGADVNVLCHGMTVYEYARQHQSLEIASLLMPIPPGISAHHCFYTRMPVANDKLFPSFIVVNNFIKPPR